MEFGWNQIHWEFVSMTTELLYGFLQRTICIKSSLVQNKYFLRIGQQGGGWVGRHDQLSNKIVGLNCGWEEMIVQQKWFLRMAIFGLPQHP